MTTDPSVDDPAVGHVTEWFGTHLPAGLFTGPPEVALDPDEILVVGPIAVPEVPAGADEATRDGLKAAAVRSFREDTRGQRMEVAQEAERLFQRRVSWGVICGDRRELFTTVNAPVMTRLRLAERKVLDTLVASGVARSRSDALGWCVRLVGKHEADWLTDLRDALVGVQRVRAEGPTAI